MLSIFTVLTIEAQETQVPQLTRILFVLDGSQSMLAKWESGTKMKVAQDLLSDMVDSLKFDKNIEMALRVYGHQKPVPPQRCDDTKLEVPFAKDNAKRIKDKLDAVNPKGTTPIAYSLEQSATDFPKSKDCRNIIILITDGIESCDGDPCAVSLALQSQGIILKPFVIGVGLNDEFKDTFDCVGRYYDASNEQRFKEVLDVVVSQALNTTSIQVDLLDMNKRPTESNVNMTFYDRFSGAVMYNFIHTINYKGNPDTLKIDPVPTYDIVVHTIPPVRKDSVIINPGEHNTVKIDAPRGSLIVKTTAPEYRDLQFIVRKNGYKETLNVQSINSEEKYIVGNYDIELLTIPRMKFDNIVIDQSKTNSMFIPNPGLITFVASAPPVGALYKQSGNKLEWIMNLNSNDNIQTLAILPGKYIAICRPKNARESVYTSKREFTVISGGADKVVLF